MEEEIKNFIKVWILAITSLSYTYYISSKLPKGIIRLFSLLPIIYLFTILPLSLSSFHLSGLTAFFLVWLANFKLLLFAFDQGPLSPPPPNLFHFISISCLPIKIKQNPPPDLTSQENPPTHFVQKVFYLILFAVKLSLLVIIIRSYEYKKHMHPNAVLALYCLHMYLELEVSLVLVVTPARAIFGFELEPQFNEPYLATSLQDFWGRRWNLMVPSILRPTIYYPIRRTFTHLIGPKWATLMGLVASFVVSGLMHEAIFYYLTRVSPTWEVTCFFVLHGICTAVEVVVKKEVGTDKRRLHRAVSGPLVLSFVAVTGVWLLFPQLTRNGVDEKTIEEYSIVLDFVRDKFGILRQKAMHIW
ncbi:long-chain-alcohol O-fatty-acyltransferase 5 [Tripterygium wilfordii]|uniref:Long-chain-alcohol O-fatty-acyltransferase 5 n=1 Tax=Tripterygium wilfordii TaxID=458696 RepID=A0A7J7C2Q4_TRIWF|nr:probable long-chain-alcohol O-fatty-acyltransferase 1 [Tripterygium wilfordii]KAF5728434.1 long-chain-alcohol O-fatty-acyltransferase 5 [Tripterygium wilfordii]